MTDTTNHPLSDETILALELAHGDFRSRMRAAHDLGREHEREHGDGWEPLTDLDTIRKGDEVEMTRTHSDGATETTRGVAYYRSGSGNWLSENHVLLTRIADDNDTYRVRRAPKPVLPTNQGAIIRDVTLDGNTCAIMVLGKHDLWVGVDQDGEGQWWSPIWIESSGTWRADRGERDE